MKVHMIKRRVNEMLIPPPPPPPPKKKKKKKKERLGDTCIYFQENFK